MPSLSMQNAAYDEQAAREEARQAKSRLTQTTKRRSTAEQAWKDAIKAAHAAGLSARAIAPLAGVSHQRVHQLLSE